MTDYNGFPDDSGIPAWLYEGAPLGSIPLWNGLDSWLVRFESVHAGNLNQPKVVAPSSYVSAGTLVARPTAGPLVLNIPMGGVPIPLHIHHPVVTMQISGTGPSVAGTNGVIAGVLDTEQLIAELKKIVGAFDSSLCSSNTFESIAMQIRQASDIMKDGTNGEPAVTCNAISIGLGFSASAATIGGVAPPAAAPQDPCAN